MKTRTLLAMGIWMLAGVLLGPSPARAQDFEDGDNPVVETRTSRSRVTEYDPWDDRTIVHRRASRDRTRESYYDADRSRAFADPGSTRRVNRPIYDDDGNVIGREVGTQWTNNGVAHGDLRKIKSKRNRSGGTDRTSDTIHYYQAEPGR